MEALSYISLLVVEDDTFARDSLVRMLSEDTCNLWVAGDGEEAWELFLAHKPDIILTDIRMPRMDGIELCRRVHEEFPECPIVIMTAYHDEEYLIEAIRYGIKDYVFKPIDFNDLKNRLEKIAEFLVARKEIQRHEKMMHALLDHQKNIVLLSDGKHPYGCNRMFLEFFGFETLEAFTKEHHCVCSLFLEKGDEYLHPPHDKGDISWMERLVESGYEAKAVMLDRRTEEERIFLIHATSIEHENDDLHMVVSFSDITDQERILVMQSRHAALGEMIAAIAHQLKQPLSAISLLAGMLQEDYEEEKIDLEKVGQYARMVQSEVGFMATTITHLRNFLLPSREKELFSVVTAMDEVLEIITPIMHKNGIEVAFEYENGEKSEYVLHGIKGEFQQVVLNLLSNARDAISEKKECGNITIQLKNSLENLQISVQDSGGGIREEMISRLFDVHVTSKQEGTGIGLSLARKIVQKMGGVIRAENSGKGALFTLMLPRESA